jgi:DNA-binding transcriptional MerR regulator
VASYSTSEVERILGLPSSTLRHWEREVALLQPRKDPFGRRMYSEADLRLIIRLKHLALDKGLGLSAARERLEAELSGPMPDERARIDEVRGELLALLAKSGEAGRKLEGPRSLLEGASSRRKPRSRS